MEEEIKTATTLTTNIQHQVFEDVLVEMLDRSGGEERGGI
jgi:hypothetical protein